MIELKSPRELEIMAKAGKIVADAHRIVRENIRPGITTGELDRLVEVYMKQCGAVSAFKGYHGFPAHICTSVNEQVVHGIPGDVILQDGDIVSIDIGSIYNGYHGDAADTYPVGKISIEAAELIQTTKESFYEGLKFARLGCRLSDISYAIQSYVEGRGHSVVRTFVGHGIGQQMHEEPQIPNFGPPGKGPRLRPGMTLAIEPMVNQGTYQVDTLKDGWTVVTKDRRLSAHYEHTIVIMDGEPIILTLEG